MKIAVYGRKVPSQHFLKIQRFFELFFEKQIEVVVCETFYRFIETHIPLPFSLKKYERVEEIEEVDLLVSIGGDGAFLDAANTIGKLPVPIIGINAGRLGFLSSTSIDDVDNVVDKIINRNYKIEERTLLSMYNPSNSFGLHAFALNEFTILKKDTSSMITIHTYINDEYLNSYWADGLIIATPTGSTAYSLSCGGPILLQGNDSFIITPIAPHSLTVRPLVIPASSTIKLVPESRENNFMISLDSRYATISSEEIIIQKADFKIHVVRLPGETEIKTLRNKLNWGLDKRN